MGANESKPLELSVGRWGNSLAVRLPAELARELGAVDGGTLQLTRLADQRYALSARSRRQPFDRSAWRAQAQTHLAAMPGSPSVMGQVRGVARY